MKYYELLRQLPRSISRLFGSVPNWVEVKLLEPNSIALQLSRAKRNGTKTEWLKLYNFHKETLSVILFIFFLKKFVLSTHTMIDGTLSMLSALDIQEIYIGSINYSDNSESMLFLKTFYDELEDIVRDDEMLSKYLNFSYASEIVREYRMEIADEDLRL